MVWTSLCYGVNVFLVTSDDIFGLLGSDYHRPLFHTAVNVRVPNGYNHRSCSLGLLEYLLLLGIRNTMRWKYIVGQGSRHLRPNNKAIESKIARRLATP